MFNKVSMIITIVLLSYSACGIVFLLVVRIRHKLKAKRDIKNEEAKMLILEADLYENQEKTK